MVGFCLFKLIALITNLAFDLRWSFSEAVPNTAHLHGWVILIPALGGLLIGILAHYGSRRSGDTGSTR